MSAAPTLLDDALALAGAGVPVFPCGGDKAPVCVGGFKAATTDPNRVRSLFAHSAARLIGMPTGKASGVVAIDIDPRHTGDLWHDENRAQLPPTRTHLTGGGGTHLIFQAGEWGIRNSAGKVKDGRKIGIAPGVDVRGDGGYIIVPPSPGYAITDAMPPAEIPSWLGALCRRPPEEAQLPPPARPARTAPPEAGSTPYGAAALTSACAAIRNAYEGQKHDTLNRECYAIGGLVAAGEILESEAIRDLLDALHDMHARTPCKDFRAAEKTVRRSFREGMARPRAVEERAPLPAPDEIHPAAPLLAKLAADADAAIQRAARKSAKNQMAQQAEIPAGVYDVDGLLKEILDDCLARSYRPQPFLSLAAAISAVAVAAGRRYCTETGLRSNLYIIGVAPSGAGKDFPLDYARRALSAADLVNHLGGEELASGSGLITAMAAHPVRLFCLDEMGLMLQAITGKKAAPYKAEIMALFMKFFSRANSIFYGKQYANVKENPRVDIQNPHVAIFGATTPSTLWAALEGGALVDGSIARFLVFSADQNAVSRNKNMTGGDFPESILEGLKAVSRGAEGHDYGGNLSAAMVSTAPMPPFTVPYSPAGHDAMEAYFDRQEAWLEKINGNHDEAARPGEGEIVSRIGEHAAKLAMVAAIGRNAAAPVIEARDVEWAALLTDHAARTLLNQSALYIADNEYEKKLRKGYDLVARFGPITERDLIRRGFKFPDRERQEILSTLVTGGIINATRSTPGAEGGRGTVRYSAPSAGIEETSTAEE